MTNEQLLKQINGALEVIEAMAQQVKNDIVLLPPSFYVPPPFIDGPGVVPMTLSGCNDIIRYAKVIRKTVSESR